MLCPRCKKPMQVDLRTDTQILWKCPVCGHMEIEYVGTQPAPYDNMIDWGVNNEV